MTLAYDKVTRLLHWGFAILIPLQLLSEELMKRPKPGRVRDDMQVFFFDMHEWIGWAAFILVVARLVWGFVSAEASLLRLFPYVSPTGRKLLMHSIKHEIPAWFKGKVADPSKQESSLSSVIHGLGVLVVFALGATGAWMSLAMEDSGQMLGMLHDAKEVHEILGDILWYYIYAHVGMTIVHMLLGHAMLKRMFCINNKG